MSRPLLRDVESIREHGFTMVELIMVMVILGVIAAVAVPRFFSTTTFQSRGFYDQVISTLRYAQKAAIAQHRLVCVSFPANNSVTLTQGTTNACGGALVSPSGTPYPLTSSNATFSPLPAGFSFDCLGRPRSISPPVGVCGDSVGVLTVNQTVQVQGAPLITVEAETGYVH